MSNIDFVIDVCNQSINEEKHIWIAGNDKAVVTLSAKSLLQIMNRLKETEKIIDDVMALALETKRNLDQIG